MADPFPDHITGSSNFKFIDKKFTISDLVYHEERYTNKEIIKSEDFYCLETLGSLLKLAKNEKTLFDAINKK